MKKRVTFASQVRRHAALCSAAFLLSACGGTTDTMGNGPAMAAETVAAPVQAGAASVPVNAVPAVDTAVAVEAAPTVAAAPSNQTFASTEPAASEQSVNTTPASTTGAATATANFDMSGYQSTDSAPDAGQSAQAPQQAR